MSQGDSVSPEAQADRTVSLSAPTTVEEIVRSVSPDAIKSIPPEILEKLSETKAIVVSRHTQMSVTHCGPLPPPSYLEKYNEIIPQGADRIMKQAESQSAHRIEIEKKVISDQGKRESNGQWFGFIIAMVGITCGTFAIVSGHPVAGYTVCGTPLLGIVSVFVASRSKGAANLKQKREQIEEVDPRPRSHANLSKKQKRKMRKR